MSQNIFTSENIMKYKKSASFTSGVGEWVERNNEPAMSILPVPYYISSSAGYKHIFEDELNPNTQYVIDLWIDTDDVISNGTYRAGGLKIVYDNSTVGTAVATHTEGWKHLHIITPAGVSIRYFYPNYTLNLPVYYRWDSCICPISTASLTKTGIFNTTHGIENVELSTIDNAGLLRGSQLIEY